MSEFFCELICVYIVKIFAFAIIQNSINLSLTFIL